MSNTLIIDPFNGIGGDMLVSAFVDAGLPISYIEENLLKVLTSKEFNFNFETTNQNGITGKKLKLKEIPFKNRSFYSIKFLLENSSLSNFVKENSVKILTELAKAESIVHNYPLEKVHFHEIGAIDTIFDIVSVVLGLEFFNISECYVVSAIPVGCGEIKCSHGIMPNPAPATTILLKNFKINFTSLNLELTTPTGAAILKGLNFIQKENFICKFHKIGYGFGNAILEKRPNFLRIFIGEKENYNDEIFEIEFNIDDMTGEEIGYFIEQSSKLNILDIQCISTITKKNRPGYIFKILCKDIDNEVRNFIFSNSSTSGLRFIKKKRLTLDRKIENIKKENTLFQIKRMFEDKLNIRKSKIEFDSLKKE